MKYEGKKAAFYTLGCKLNFSETSSIAGTFNEVGFERVDFDEKADVYVINTCSVTTKIITPTTAPPPEKRTARLHPPENSLRPRKSGFCSTIFSGSKSM